MASDLLNSAAFQQTSTKTTTTSQKLKEDETDASHILNRLASEGNPLILLLCFVSAAIVAPAGEEFFFRVLLQRWLEGYEHNHRRKLRLLRMLPRGMIPIILSAAVFAAMHFRIAAPRIDFNSMVHNQIVDVVAKLLTLVFAIIFLRQYLGATISDFGWNAASFFSDIKLGLTIFAAIVPPIYLLQYLLFQFLPKEIAPDPVPIFILAIVLGTVYYRTHRIVPIIVIHAGLNATSLLLVWLYNQPQ